MGFQMAEARFRSGKDGDDGSDAEVNDDGGCDCFGDGGYGVEGSGEVVVPRWWTMDGGWAVVEGEFRGGGYVFRWSWVVDGGCVGSVVLDEDE
ncbi:hypothetical protein PIB30_107799, partial [Stylosanthes scabra]|nr:hypothetical protein [Stylosanthes scabra]